MRARLLLAARLLCRHSAVAADEPL
eukprot:COSAG02_NODE_49693_length_325_cov_0.721239_1_plen_24_part_10